MEASSRRGKVRRRLSVAASLAAVMLAFVATAGAISAWQDQNLARAAASLAQAERKQSLLIQSSFLAGLARQAHDRGDNRTAIALALQALPGRISTDDQKAQNVAQAILFAAIADYRGEKTQAVTVFFSPDGGRIATVMPDFSVQISDAATRKIITVLQGHVYAITSGAFSPDGLQIATGSLDGTVRLWDAFSGALQMTMRGPGGHITGVAFSLGSNLLVSASVDKARVWDTRSGRLVGEFLYDAAATLAAFSPDGEHLAVALIDDRVVTWDISTFKRQFVLKHADHVIGVGYSLDNNWIATAYSPGDVAIWNATTGDRISALHPPQQ